MAVNFFFTEISKFPFKVNQHKQWAKDIIISYNKKVGDISFVFCDDDYLLKMNVDYLNHDYYTDVITFNYCEGLLISGDIFISVDRIRENALTNQVSFITELERVIIHGVLHLVGFDDVTDILKCDMTLAENRALERLHTVK